MERSLACATLALTALVLPARAGHAALAAQKNSAAERANCSAARQTDVPQALITNGQGNDEVSAVIYLPDPTKGYYRGSRFDWSGVVGCLGYMGHTYFGVWFPRYDPLLHDSITGPVEEFRSADGESAPFYDDAKPGGLFLKPGIGVLHKLDDAPFKFSAPYPIVDGGRWTIHTSRRGVSFRQNLQSPPFGYVYTKTVKLDAHAPVLVLEHALKNTGTRTIDTEVYDHDFYRLDDAPTGPDITIRFPFEPTATQPPGEAARFNGARIDGKQIVFERDLETGQSIFSALTGYSQNLSDYDFFIENAKTGAGVEQSSSSPIARLVFWSIRTTVCPEAYIHLTIPPGQTAHWTIRYRFYVK